MHGQIGFGPFNYDLNEKDISIGYGPFDYNISENEFNYMFEKGNTPMENVMYGLRTVSFLSAVKNQSGSLFKVDEGKSLAGKAWQLTSRFTWEYVQTRVGMEFYNIYNNLDMIEETSNHLGNSLIRLKNSGIGLGISNYFFVGDKFDGITIKSPKTGKFNINYEMHEFGHTIQSRLLGPAWLPAIAIPSLVHSSLWNATGQNWSYHKFYTERWANILTDKYY